jgi:NADH-quinone oxidoreductase subunit I
MSSNTFTEAIKGLWSLVVGLKVTGKNFVLPQITIHYPRKTVDNIDTYRGHVELVPNPKEPDKPKCICCMMCANNCPSSCITVVPEKAPKGEGKDAKAAAAKKAPATWTLNYNLCSLCGTCVEICPVKSIAFSHDVYLASYDKNDFVYDMLAYMREKHAEAIAAAKSGAGRAEVVDTGKKMAKTGPDDSAAGPAAAK